jgi:hypothetical protein
MSSKTAGERVASHDTEHGWKLHIGEGSDLQMIGEIIFVASSSKRPKYLVMWIENERGHGVEVMIRPNSVSVDDSWKPAKKRRAAK